MANIDSPFGFRPVTVNPRRGKYTAGGTALNAGDLVSLVSGVAVLWTGAYPPAGVVEDAAAADAEVILYDDLRSTVFYAQVEDAYAATTPGNRYDIKGTTGALEIDMTTQTFGIVEILGQYLVPGSRDTGANAKVTCRIIAETMSQFRADVLLKNPGSYQSLSNNVELGESDGAFVALDPNGSGRNVTLGATLNRKGRQLVIVNKADAAENLTIKSSDGTTRAVLNQDEGAMCVNTDGSVTGWAFLGFTHVVSLAS